MDAVHTGQDLKVEVTNRQVLSIAMPITLAVLIPQINMLVNSIFLGRVSEEALGNAGITGVYYLIFAVAGNGLNNALQSVFSGFAGSGATEKFKTVLSQGIRISLQFAAICIAFTWLLAPWIMKAVSDPAAYPEEMAFLKVRIWGLPFLFLFQMGNAFLVASLNSRLLMIGFICEALTNILFDYLLIFGHAGFPEMGFQGAAWASVLAEAVGMCVVWMVLYFSGLQKKYQLLHSLQYDQPVSKQVFRVSVPLISQYIISVTTWLIFFLLIENKGTMAKAISNTMRNVFGLSGVFIWAMAGTSNTMVSNLIGQGREDLVMKAIQKIMAWSLGLCMLIVILLNLYPALFFRMFGQDEQFVQAGIPVIRIVSLGMIFMSMSSIWLNGVTGTGQTRVNLLIEIIAISIYLLYTWYFMQVHYISLAMAWSNELVYWLIMLFLSYGYLRSGRWKRQGLT